MPTLQIGRKEIPYELRRSATASERRITVTPGHVELLALATDDNAAKRDAGPCEPATSWEARPSTP